MARTAEIIAFLDQLLDAASFSDYGPNGLQVPGRNEVTSIVTGVSAHAPLIEAAAGHGVGMVLVHHGLFWRGDPLEITAVKHARLKPLYSHEIALAAYHLPLDAHPVHGNNALLAAGIGAGELEPFGAHDGRTIGIRARFPEPGGIAAATLVERVRDTVGGRDPLVIAAPSGRPVETIAIVSGGGNSFMQEAITAGCDAFLTGEPTEWAFGLATDADITYIAAGHHASETLGVRRLGELLTDRFGVEHRFVDTHNPI